MTNSSSHKPSVFSKLWRLLKPAVARFPALLALGIVTAVAITLSTSYPLFYSGIWNDQNRLIEKITERLACAGAWGMPFSVLAQLLLERRYERRTQLAAQAIIFALSIFALPPFFQIYGGRRDVLIVGVTLALCAIIMFVLTRTQGSDIAFPNFIISTAIAGIFYLLTLIGLMPLYIASEILVTDIPMRIEDNITTLLIYLPLLTLSPMIFIAFAAREREQIFLPEAYEVIVLQIFLTIGISFLALLYIYLFKCLFTRTLPEREIFLYVAFATAGYLFFYFASMPHENPFLVFFRRYGAIFILPLVAMQIVAFSNKINAEGYTPARVAALLYIIFSVPSCALTFIKRGKYMSTTFLIFAALCILGSATPLNIINLAKWMR